MRPLIIFIAVLLISEVQAQKKNIEFFPKKTIRKQIQMDPLESQNGISFTNLATNDTIHEKYYIPTSIGFYKPILNSKNEALSEFGIDVVALTQFGIRKVEDDPYYTAQYQFNMLNIDFKASLLYTVQKEKVTYRFRLYHLSSHLGDDYLLRYGYDMSGYWDGNPRNYEQFDVFIFYKNHHFDYYVGTGFVVSPNATRDRLSFQGGLNLHYPITENSNIFSGLFLTSFQETKFSPSAKMSIGIDFKREFKILLEYYEGNLPYSTFESIYVSYFGIGLYLAG